MSKENRSTLEEYFETGDRPTQQQFEELIESIIVQRDDDVWVHGPNKFVGIGEEVPEAKLHVDGNVAVEGNDLYGKNDTSHFRISNSDGPAVELHGNNKNDGRAGEIGFVASNGTQGGFRFIQDRGTGFNPRWLTMMAITKDGDVGIGTRNPINKLEIQNPGGGNTGLCLPEGAASDRVLISDGAGNARWEPKSFLDDGDWVVNGNSIVRPYGSVGVAVSNPQTTFHVGGDARIDGSKLNGNATTHHFQINAHSSSGPYIKMGGDQGLEGGYLNLTGSIGPNQQTGGGVNFFQKRRNAQGTGFTTNKTLRITKEGDVHIYNDRDIYFRGGSANTPDSSLDIYHGIGFYGPNKTFDGVNVDGPVTYGTSGGALGSTGTGKKIALQWDNGRNVDFRGNITTNGGAFLVVDRIQATGGDISYRPSAGDYGYNTGKLASEFIAACITGFGTTRALLNGQNSLAMGISTYIRNNTWWVSADIDSDGIHESWKVDILYIRNTIGIRGGVGWNGPLLQYI